MKQPEENQSDKLKKLIQESFIKCAKDPKFFLTNFCFIQHPQRGKIRFELFKYQEETLDAFEEFDFNLILKGRQIGISTLVAGYALWLMMFHEDKNILVISKDQATAKNLVTKVKVMNEMLPTWLQRKFDENNKLTLRLANGSQIKAIARSKDAGRSEALSLLVIDEAAFIDEIDHIWTAASSTLATGGRAILLSTPNGQGNFFHTEWQKAQSGENEFNPILLDWRVHPDRDQAWRDKQDKIMGEIAAAQEHDASFIFSGNTVIPPEYIQFMKETYVQEPIEKTFIDKGLWRWEYPQANKSYVVCADVGRGNSEDNSAFHVLDIDTMNQVAEYKGKLDTKLYGDLLVQVATEYNDALLVPENSNIGWATIQQIIDREYKNLFYMSKDLQVVDVQQQYFSNYYRDEKTLIPGFTTSPKTRPLIINKLDEYIRGKSIVIRSLRTIHELEVFIWNNGKAEAMQGKHDDLIMALGIGLWVRDTALRLRTERMEMAKQNLDHLTTSIIPFNNSAKPDPYKMHTDKGMEDLRWLLG